MMKSCSRIIFWHFLRRRSLHPPWTNHIRRWIRLQPCWWRLGCIRMKPWNRPSWSSRQTSGMWTSRALRKTWCWRRTPRSSSIPSWTSLSTARRRYVGWDNNVGRSIHEFASMISLDTAGTFLLFFSPSGTFDFPPPTALTLHKKSISIAIIQGYLGEGNVPQRQFVDVEDLHLLVEADDDMNELEEVHRVGPCTLRLSQQGSARSSLPSWLDRGTGCSRIARRMERCGCNIIESAFALLLPRVNSLFVFCVFDYPRVSRWTLSAVLCGSKCPSRKMRTCRIPELIDAHSLLNLSRCSHSLTTYHSFVRTILFWTKRKFCFCTKALFGTCCLTAVDVFNRRTARADKLTDTIPLWSRINFL